MSDDHPSIQLPPEPPAWEKYAYHPADWHLIWLVPAASTLATLLGVVAFGYWPTKNNWLAMAGLTVLILAASWIVDRLDTVIRSIRVALSGIVFAAGIGAHAIVLLAFGAGSMLTPPIWAWRTVTIEDTFAVNAPNQRGDDVKKKSDVKFPIHLGEVHVRHFKGNEFELYTWTFLKEPPPKEEEILDWLCAGPLAVDPVERQQNGTSRKNEMLAFDYVDRRISPGHSNHCRLAIRGRFACFTSKISSPHLDHSDRRYLESMRILKDR